MITSFHFVRLLRSELRRGVVDALREALPDAVVSVPADAHAEAAWDLSVHQPVRDASEGEALHAIVTATIDGQGQVHKSWCMEAVQ